MFNKNIKIANKQISENSPVFIIGEAGVNHNGDMKVARKLVDMAVVARVDAIKFQAFKTDELILKNVGKANYQSKTTDRTESQYNMLKKLEISKQQNIELQEYCRSKGIIFLTTPFDEKSLEELDELDLPAYKVASTDLTNLSFLKRIAKKNKPILLSTGMSYMEEIELALKTIYEYNRNVILLQCIANYPAFDNEANINVIDTFRKKYDMILGYSDHTFGIGASPYAVAKGVKVIEKHFTLDKTSIGPDHSASLDSDELKIFVNQIRQVENYMGDGIKRPSISENQNRLLLQKCLVAAKNIKKDEIFDENNIVAKRTGGIGISPIYIYEIIGQKAKYDFEKNQIIEI